MTSAIPTSDTTASTPRPFFVPSGVNFDELPENLKVAIAGVIGPAYDRLVLQAEDGLEKSSGVTFIHLLWLEVLDQLELAQGLEKSRHLETSEERSKQIDRHLRVVGAKSKISHFLFRLKEFRRKWGVGLAIPEPVPEVIEPPGGWSDNQTGG